MKQDPLEQAAKEYAEMHLDVSGNLGKYLVKAIFQDGAKWQQEQDKKCYHPLPYRLAKSDFNFECTLCGKFI